MNKAELNNLPLIMLQRMVSEKGRNPDGLDRDEMIDKLSDKPKAKKEVELDSE